MTARKIKKSSSSSSDQVQNYINDILARYKDGNNATEHTYRASLQTLIESILKNSMATNEPQRIDCGAPDYIITNGPIPIGYIEAKDLGKDLDDAEESEQLHRYFASLDNLILTNYLEFRWYIKGKLRLSCSIGELKRKKLDFKESQFAILISLLESFYRAEVPSIKSAEELAERLAGSTSSICQLISKAYD